MRTIRTARRPAATLLAPAGENSALLDFVARWRRPFCWLGVALGSPLGLAAQLRWHHQGRDRLFASHQAVGRGSRVAPPSHP